MKERARRKKSLSLSLSLDGKNATWWRALFRRVVRALTATPNDEPMQRNLFLELARARALNLSLSLSLSTLCLGVEQPRGLHATNTMRGRRPRVEVPSTPERLFVREREKLSGTFPPGGETASSAIESHRSSDSLRSPTTARLSLSLSWERRIAKYLAGCHSGRLRRAQRRGEAQELRRALRARARRRSFGPFCELGFGLGDFRRGRWVFDTTIDRPNRTHDPPPRPKMNDDDERSQAHAAGGERRAHAPRAPIFIFRLRERERERHWFFVLKRTVRAFCAGTKRPSAEV